MSNHPHLAFPKVPGHFQFRQASRLGRYISSAGSPSQTLLSRSHSHQSCLTAHSRCRLHQRCQTFCRLHCPLVIMAGDVPSTAKALKFDKAGKPLDALHLADVPVKECSGSEVTVKMLARSCKSQVRTLLFLHGAAARLAPQRSTQSRAIFQCCCNQTRARTLLGAAGPGVYSG